MFWVNKSFPVHKKLQTYLFKLNESSEDSENLVDSIIWNNFRCFAKPLIAQDPAKLEMDRGGNAFGTYGQSDVEEAEDLNGSPWNNASHRIFDDSMALGKAFMDTRFEHGFEDTFGIITRSTLGFFMDTIHLEWENF